VGLQSSPGLDKSVRPSPKNDKQKGAKGMIQVASLLPRKCNTLV
jgi:hypothetical protein